MTRPLVTQHGTANLTRAFRANGCIDCGVRYPEVDWDELHIHHKDGRDPGDRAKRLDRMPIEELMRHLLQSQVRCSYHHHLWHKKIKERKVPVEQMALFYGNGHFIYNKETAS